MAFVIRIKEESDLVVGAEMRGSRSGAEYTFRFNFNRLGFNYLRDSQVQ